MKRIVSLLVRFWRAQVLVFVEVVKNGRDLQKEFVRLVEQAQTDELTMLLNVRGLLRALDNEWARSRREGYSFCVVYMDLDEFKLVNDTRGHEAGNGVLRAFVNCAKRVLRPYDWFARVGGDEFVIILSRLDESAAEEVMKRITESVAELNAAKSKQPNWSFISFSYGICSSRLAPDTEEMIFTADRNMYADKTRKSQRFQPIATAAREVAR